MNALDRNSVGTPSTRSRFRTHGFTLVELLVTITIIAVLAALSMMGVSNIRISAAKARTTSQLRQIAVSVSLWAVEKNNGEPFYVGNGTGTYSHESAPGLNPKLAPGNPAMLLYNKDSPSDGYLTDYTLFFSPLAKYTVPERKNYKPEAADTIKLWGTYAWFYPVNVWEKLTAHQTDSIGPGAWAVSKVSPAAAGKLMLASDYTNCPPVGKKIYVALFVDGSVQEIAQNEAAWKKWIWGN